MSRVCRQRALPRLAGSGRNPGHCLSMQDTLSLESSLMCRCCSVCRARPHLFRPQWPPLKQPCRTLASQPLHTHPACVQGATWALPRCTCCTAPQACQAPSRWCRACTWGASRRPGLLSRTATSIAPTSGALPAALRAWLRTRPAARLGFRAELLVCTLCKALQLWAQRMPMW